MQIVTEILKKVELAGAQVVAVTKYFSPEDTKNLVDELTKFPVVLGIGENRIADIRNKNIPREQLHFIGNIQSRDIPEITKLSSVIHSVCHLKHAEIIAKQENVSAVFLQINISREPQKAGVLPEEFSSFLTQIQQLSLEILGISAMGAGEFDEQQKRKEFRELIQLRDRYLPGKKISAGTSRDFEIALEEGIEIVRVGQALFEEEKNLYLSEKTIQIT